MKENLKTGFWIGLGLILAFLILNVAASFVGRAAKAV